MNKNENGLLNFSIRDLIWLITIVAICIMWLHGLQKERAALEREQEARQQLATTQLRVQQLEAEKAQQAAYAKLNLVKIKNELATALDKLKRQEYLQKNSSNGSRDQD